MGPVEGLRRVVLRLGLDVHRRGYTSADRLARTLETHGVDLVLDVGANVGGFVKQLRNHGYRHRAESFEPLSAPYSRLLEASRRDALWKVHNFALGRKSVAEAEMNVAANGGASSSLLPMLERHMKAAPEAMIVSRESIAVKALDEIWPMVIGGASRPFLKIDAQGYELQILEGTVSHLHSIVGLQLELSLAPLYDGAPGYQDLLALMPEWGFELVGIDPGLFDMSAGELLQFDGIFIRT